MRLAEAERDLAHARIWHVKIERRGGIDFCQGCLANWPCAEIRMAELQAAFARLWTAARELVDTDAQYAWIKENGGAGSGVRHLNATVNLGKLADLDALLILLDPETTHPPA